MKKKAEPRGESALKNGFRSLFSLSSQIRKLLSTGDTLPGIWLSCAVILTSFALLPLPSVWKAAAAAAAVLVFIVLSFLHQLRGLPALPVLLAFGVALAALSAHTFDVRCYRPVLHCAGSNLDTEATVLDYGTRYDDRLRVKIRVFRLNGQDIRPFLSTIYLSADDAPESGMTLSGRLHYRIPEDTADFARESYYRAHRIYVTAETRGAYSLSPAPASFSYSFIRYVLPARCAHWFGERLDALYEAGDAGILLSLILGDKSKLPPGFEDDMRTVGLSHVMAVSGMNVSLISGFFLLLFLRRRAGAAAAIPAVILFAFITGAGASVVRAVIMQIILLAALLLGERAESTNSLFVTAAFMLVMNPYAVQDAGLWLSFFSTLGLTRYGARFRAAMMKPFRVLPWPVRRLISLPVTMLATTLTAQVFVLPILVFLFGSFSLIAPLANLLVVWATELAFAGGIVTALLSPFLPGAAQFLAKPVSALVGFQRWIVPRMADWPVSTLSAQDRYVVIGLVTLYAELLLLYLDRSRKLLRCMLSSCAIALCCIAFLGMLDADRTLEITSLDTRGGQCTVLIRGGDCAVINCGGIGAGEKLAEFLESRSIRTIDLLLLTDGKSASKSGLSDLLAAVPVDTMLLPASGADDVPSAAARCYTVTDDLLLTVGGAQLQVLVSDTEGFDACRMAAYLTAGGYSFLIPGSIGADELSAILSRRGIPGANVAVAGDYYTTHLPPFSADLCLLSSYVELNRSTVAALQARGMTAVDLSQTGDVTFTVRMRRTSVK